MWKKPSNTNKEIRIIIVTTGQPSTNPRVVKEYLALKHAGYNVKVLYAFWANWAELTDKKIFQSGSLLAEDFILVGGSPQTFSFVYWTSRYIHSMLKWLEWMLPFFLKQWSIARPSIFLALESFRQHADLYIAHNLGALPAAYWAANKSKVKFAFDAEDYHRGETVRGTRSHNLAILMENFYIPRAHYVSTASIAIEREYEKSFPKQNFAVIDNVFSKRQQPTYKKLPKDELTIFWFSQTIGLDRGLSDFFNALKFLQDIPVSLSLLGYCTEENKQYISSFFVNDLHVIRFLDPCPEDTLIEISSSHHIGLALERTEPENRNLCLTNKIFTYILAGNAILASNTLAQQEFIQCYSEVGQLYEIGNDREMALKIRFWWENPQRLEHSRESSWHLAHEKLNWEQERNKFLELVKLSL